MERSIPDLPWNRRSPKQAKQKRKAESGIFDGKSRPFHQANALLISFGLSGAVSPNSILGNEKMEFGDTAPEFVSDGRRSNAPVLGRLLNPQGVHPSDFDDIPGSCSSASTSADKRYSSSAPHHGKSGKQSRHSREVCDQSKHGPAKNECDSRIMASPRNKSRPPS